VRYGLRASLLIALLGVISSADGQVRARQPSEDLGSTQRCARYGGLPAGFVAQPAAGMVYVPAGSFVPGSQHGYLEERGDEREVSVAGFYIDRTEVTNAQFERFVGATGYVTLAEREGSAPVFYVPTQAELEQRDHAWWTRVAGASWRKPSGPSSKMQRNRPVVQVVYADALAYARWLGHELPSELQWEYAAKALRSSEALHHEPRNSKGQPTANFWQGDFPLHNAREDGFAELAPVGCYEPNPFGLHDMLGNVWEWTANAYTVSQRERDQDSASCSPEAVGARLVIKGGSFLCASSYCARYRVAARHMQEADQPSMHIGFRTVLNAAR
jgi:formylglycine-generating enzyme required for sulfatase activity